MIRRLGLRFRSFLSGVLRRNLPRRAEEQVLHPTQDELVKVISNARHEAQEAYEVTLDIGEDMQAIIDEADVTIPLVPYMNAGQTEGLIVVWSSLGNQAGELRDRLDDFTMDSDSAGSTASISSVSVSGVFTPEFASFDDPGFQVAWGGYMAHAARPALRESIEKLLKEFGFDDPQYPGEKSPLEQFRIAHEAFNTPVTDSDPASTSLIPLRECIHSVLDGLFRARPVPEAAGRNQRKKLISIATQLKSDSLPDEVAQEWADEWHDLNTGDLSGAKRQEMTREEWERRLRRGTSFLHSLLKGLDMSKFARPG